MSSFGLTICDPAIRPGRIATTVVVPLPCSGERAPFPSCITCGPIRLPTTWTVVWLWIIQSAHTVSIHAGRRVSTHRRRANSPISPRMAFPKMPRGNCTLCDHPVDDRIASHRFLVVPTTLYPVCSQIYFLESTWNSKEGRFSLVTESIIRDSTPVNLLSTEPNANSILSVDRQQKIH